MQNSLNTQRKNLKKKIDIYSNQFVPGGKLHETAKIAIRNNVKSLMTGLIEVKVRFDKNGKRYSQPTIIWVKEITEQIKNRI